MKRYHSEHRSEPWYERYIPEPNSGCWIWLGAVSTKHGYGVIQPYGANSRQHKAHRLMYELHKGPVPDGMLACHRCDNRLCCNPDHIFIAKHADNTHDMINKGRANWSRGEQRSTKLRATDVLKIRNDPRPNSVIAREYGVAHPTICNIKSRRNWKHL